VTRRFLIVLIALLGGSVLSFTALILVTPLCIAALITFLFHDTSVGWVCLILALVSGVTGIAAAGRPRGHAQRMREAAERIRQENRARA
jgi:polyferredoxin